jgi:hypothetical protein
MSVDMAVVTMDVSVTAGARRVVSEGSAFGQDSVGIAGARRRHKRDAL